MYYRVALSVDNILFSIPPFNNLFIDLWYTAKQKPFKLSHVHATYGVVHPSCEEGYKDAKGTNQIMKTLLGSNVQGEKLVAIIVNHRQYFRI